jgi:aryl-alcohol dehydrogenase-like predicted oxidoreductase
MQHSHASANMRQGIANSPAWVVAKANQYARDHAMTPFTIYQGIWNVMERDFERDIIPMARSEGDAVVFRSSHHTDSNATVLGMALAPFSVLAGGKFRTDAEEARRREARDYRKVLPVWERDEKEKKVSAALEKVARELGAKHITAGGLFLNFGRMAD